MEAYPPNSRLSKTTPEAPAKPTPVVREPVQRVIKGKIIEKKKPLGVRFKELFISDDSRGVGSFLVLEVIVPALRDIVADVVSQGVEKVLYGQVRSTSRRTGGYRPSPTVPYTNYNARPAPSSPPWPTARTVPARDLSPQARATHDLREIVFQTRDEAIDILEWLRDRIARYTSTTIEELYTAVGIRSDYTDRSWGWRNLDAAEIVRVPNGYWLRLPPTEEVDS